jgi:hypothetical protein
MDTSIPQNLAQCAFDFDTLASQPNGQVSRDIPERHVVRTECTSDGCNKPIVNKKRGMCKRCYAYWLMTDAPHKPRCPIEGCERPIWTHGYCNIHYRRGERAGGDPNDAPGRGSPGKGRGIRALKGEHMTSHGYRRIRIEDPDGGTVRWVLEHRYVMEQHIGRPLLSGENVHHIDGNKINNDISNLELWINIPQPHGIRAQDAVAWAKEILERYGE